jgi:hypothetical protein
MIDFLISDFFCVCMCVDIESISIHDPLPYECFPCKIGIIFFPVDIVLMSNDRVFFLICDFFSCQYREYHVDIDS